MAQDRTSRRIVILGGGFAGVETAIALEKGMSRHERETTEIVLVSENNYLVFQPLLPEVISGTLETLHCIAPIRRLTRWTKLYTRRIERIDLKARQVQLAPGYLPKPLTLNYDHLVIALGTQLNFDLVPGSREHALPFKYLEDALRLRNRIVQALEEADNEPDLAEKQRLLTFLVAGGGFSGVECLAELNDFVQAAVHAYRNIRPEEIRCVLVQSGERILPELDAGLASYAQAILERRGIEIHLNTRMKAVSADAVVIQAKTGGEPQQIPTRTVVTTVPAAPHPLISQLECPQERGRITVDEHLRVTDCDGLWSLGDCAAVPQKDGITSPPTAQHAVRQAKTCAKNILNSLRGKPLKPFLFTGLGKLASLGQRAAVAEVMGIKLRGFLAWLAWRTIYLSKFPGWSGKMRVAIDWTADILLPRDITQLRIRRDDAVHREHFHTGEIIFDAGDFGDKLYVVVRGDVEILKGAAIIATLGEREVFGEMALVSDHGRSATVRAKTDVDVVTVSRSAFQQLVNYLPGVSPAIEEIIQKHGATLPELTGVGNTHDG